MSTIHEMEALTNLMQRDPEYAWGWHCNIAVPLMDSAGLSHEDANQAASVLMRHLFAVDMTKHPHYAYPQHDSRPVPTCGDMAEAVLAMPS
jgi:hypothetical protein